MTPEPWWMVSEMAARRSAVAFLKLLPGLAKFAIVAVLAWKLIELMPQWVEAAFALAVCVWLFYGKKAK
jgi:hypothetical protein